MIVGVMVGEEIVEVEIVVMRVRDGVGGGEGDGVNESGM